MTEPDESSAFEADDGAGVYLSVAQGGARNRSWRDRFQLYRDSNTVWLVVKGDTQAALINIAGLGEADPVRPDSDL